MTFAKPLMLMSAAVIGLAACEPVTEDNRRTYSGATIGAISGAVLGAATGGREDRMERAVVAGAIGAGIGGVVGASLDRQAAELRRDLGNNVDVRNTGQELVVTMPQDILFATDSAVVRPDLQQDLRTLSRNLNAYPNSSVRVVGHTDSTGPEAYNQSLSERRAGSVAQVLINSGVSAGRISAIGRGEYQPIATNDTASGRQQNRRVEIIITPHG